MANKALESILGYFFDPTGGAGAASFNALGGVTHIGFGGGRAGGGPVAAGGLYQVNENGPGEMLSVGGRQFLMMGPQAGVVTPTKQHGAGGATINIAVQPTSTRRTAEQVAAAVARQQQLVMARS